MPSYDVVTETELWLVKIGDNLIISEPWVKDRRTGKGMSKMVSADVLKVIKPGTPLTIMIDDYEEVHFGDNPPKAF